MVFKEELRSKFNVSFSHVIRYLWSPHAFLQNILIVAQVSLEILNFEIQLFSTLMASQMGAFLHASLEKMALLDVSLIRIQCNEFILI